MKQSSFLKTTSSASPTETLKPLIFEIGGEGLSSVSVDSVITVSAGCTIRFQLASGGHWYGHGFAQRQPYPLDAEPVVNGQFAVNNIQSPIWMCSAGYALLANTVQMLNVRSNENGSGWLEVHCQKTPITIQIFCGKDLPEAHGKLMRFLQWPPSAPEKSLFGDSIFCTWTQYPRAITQDRILDMAREIRRREFPCSVITIDDRWESAFGELSFSHDFPNPQAMVKELHEMGFRVLLWVTPFVNQEASTFSWLGGNGFLAKSKDGSGPSLLKWWGGTAGIVDLSNPDARAWYRTQLLRLMQEIGVDGFKIDGGDAKYQPDSVKTSWHEDVGPSGYVDLLLGLFEEIAPGFCESRTGWLSQRRNILWREGGKDSNWGVANGLQALVNLGLHLSLMGYDLLIPDMIPGRIQTLVSNHPLPTDELFIRWTEATALMPFMQFSYFPWNYSETTNVIALRYAQLHKALEDYLHEQALNRRSPLLRPLWYDYPRQVTFYSIGDEFMLGSDILVAPVMEEGQEMRDILLPPGEWVDAWTGQIYCQNLILQHPSPCPGMPMFIRASRMDIFEKVNRILTTLDRGSIISGITTSNYSCGLDRNLSVTG